MTGLEALQSVQYVSAKARRFAVVPIDEWEALVEWLETLDDLQTVRSALAELKRSGGDRERAGWQRWEDVRDDL